MRRTASDLYNEALLLPEVERVHLADLLEASVSEEEVERSWLSEAHRRLQEIESGSVEMLPGGEVMARLRGRNARG